MTDLLHRFHNEAGEYLWQQNLTASPPLGATMRYFLTEEELKLLRKCRSESMPIYERATANDWIVKDILFVSDPVVIDNNHGHIYLSGQTHAYITVTLAPKPKAPQTKPLSVDAAREAFLSMVADSREFEVSYDGDADGEGRTVMSYDYAIRGDGGNLLALCEALGIKPGYMESLQDCIDRYVQTPAG